MHSLSNRWTPFVLASLVLHGIVLAARVPFVIPDFPRPIEDWIAVEFVAPAPDSVVEPAAEPPEPPQADTLIEPAPTAAPVPVEMRPVEPRPQPEPPIPEPAVPEPSIPEPVTPEPTVPEPLISQSVPAEEVAPVVDHPVASSEPEVPRDEAVRREFVQEDPPPPLAVDDPRPAAPDDWTVPAFEPELPADFPDPSSGLPAPSTLPGTGVPTSTPALTAAPDSAAAPAPQRFVPLYRLTRTPSFVRQVVPEYPEEERAFGREAEVLAEVRVGADGSVLGVEIVRSAGTAFDQAVRQALGRCRFEPGRLGDVAVPVKLRIPFHFRLD